MSAPTVTLTRDGKHVRLAAVTGQIAAQRFDGDPAAGATYLGTTRFPAKTLDEVVAHYERMGWQQATTPDIETKAES
jgi:hypothetical protein